jgi:hypothetical protein
LTTDSEGSCIGVCDGSDDAEYEDGSFHCWRIGVRIGVSEREVFWAEERRELPISDSAKSRFSVRKPWWTAVANEVSQL